MEKFSEDFKTKREAEQKVNELTKNGYRAYIVEWGTFNGFIYTVYARKFI